MSNFVMIIFFFVILCNSVSFSLIYFEVAVRGIIAISYCSIVLSCFFHDFP